MLIAVTTGGKIALAVAAGLFIVFAIASSFYFPRRDPDFPGKRLGTFVVISVLLFVVMIGRDGRVRRRERGGACGR